MRLNPFPRQERCVDRVFFWVEFVVTMIYERAFCCSAHLCKAVLRASSVPRKKAGGRGERVEHREDNGEEKRLSPGAGNDRAFNIQFHTSHVREGGEGG